MEINSKTTDEVVLAELGARLERTRLERDMSQLELAAEAGVERKSVQRMEGGQPVRLVSFIRVLRVLDLLDALDRLVPEPQPSPIELLKLHGRRRRRASGERGRDAADAEEANESWRWGDERPGGAP